MASAATLADSVEAWRRCFQVARGHARSAQLDERAVQRMAEAWRACDGIEVRALSQRGLLRQHAVGEHRERRRPGEDEPHLAESERQLSRREDVDVEVRAVDLRQPAAEVRAEEGFTDEDDDGSERVVALRFGDGARELGLQRFNRAGHEG